MIFKLVAYKSSNPEFMKDNVDILIVEDELITALDIKYILKKRGYNVIKIVSSGEEAIRTALSFKPDIVLMDINLKGRVNGLQAAEEILDYQIPVIFITAQRDETTVEKMEQLSSDYIFKPFHEFILEEKIQKILNN